MKILIYTIASLVALLILTIVATFWWAAQSDGPLGPIPGGGLSSGDLISTADTDWPSAISEKIANQNEAPLFVELQLTEPLSSRLTGIMLFDNSLVIPCDLGFGWARFSGSRRWILHLIYLFKNWHERALLDGRAMLRIEGKLYPGQLHKITDPEQIAALQNQMENMVEQWQPPGESWGPRPTSGPRDIWFFRFVPGAD